MLTLNSSDDKQTTSFPLFGTATAPKTTHLISDNTSLLAPATSSDSNLDTCSFYSGPSDSTIVAFCESAGSIAYSGESSSSGVSLAYSGGGESCGSIATSSSSSCSSSFSGGGCSITC